jgi:hypothetical protein
MLAMWALICKAVPQQAGPLLTDAAAESDIMTMHCFSTTCFDTPVITYQHVARPRSQLSSHGAEVNGLIKVMSHPGLKPHNSSMLHLLLL